MDEKEQNGVAVSHRSFKPSQKGLNPSGEDRENKLEGKRSLSFAGSEVGNEDVVDGSQRVDIDTKSIGERSHRSARSGKSGTSRRTGKSGGGQSFGSDNSSITGSHGKSVADTSVRKLTYMIYAFVSFVLHCFYLAGVLILGSKDGMTLPFSKDIFVYAGPVIAIFWARFSYLVCAQALDEGFGAFVGYLLSRKEGFSIVACGFVQSNFSDKITFANRLSFRSTAKPLLSKASFIWIFHALNFIFAIIASTSISAESSQIDGTNLMCIEYGQDGMAFNRGVPTIRNEMGGAELVDGTALGLLRAHDADLHYTTHVFPPQLIDVCQDGSTIKGNGFATDISTTCNCVDDVDAASLQVGGIPSTISAAMSLKATSMQNYPGWVNHVSFDSTNNSVTVQSILTGFSICGGTSPLSQSVNSTETASASVCTTKIWNHRHSFILVTYKTDGTPASIACKRVDILEEGEAADMGWLDESMNSFLESESATNISTHPLPSHWPGSVNPLLWFTSTNTRDAGLGLVEPGIEAAMALVVRGSIQRSYSTVGSTCVQRIFNEMEVTLRMANYGYTCALIWVIVQFLLNGLIFLFYVPWWLQKHPILPAIEAAQQSIIFSLLAAKNVPTMNKIKTMSSNLEVGLTWPRLDMILRIGESVQSIDDPERGVIVMDKPKIVVPLSYDKIYV